MHSSLGLVFDFLSGVSKLTTSGIVKRTKYIGKNRFCPPKEARVRSKPQATGMTNYRRSSIDIHNCMEMIDAAGHDHTGSVNVVGRCLNKGG